MSDLHQPGLIGTLQKLNDGNTAQLEVELTTAAAARPITLLLPCHGRDLRAPAFAQILAELSGATFLREVVLSLNGITGDDLRRAREALAATSLPHRILWCDQPSLLEPWLRWFGEPATALPAAKGFNVWAALGVILRADPPAVIALHDADIASYRRELLVRLAVPAVHPQFGHLATKGYYSRVAGRIFGRVTRLFVAPLLQAITRLCGHHPLLDFLLSFRYPLAGEMALTGPVAARLACRDGWGLEIGLLCGLFRETEPARLCQVDLGVNYEHKHQPAGAPDGLPAMAREIAGVLFEELAREGLNLDARFRAALPAAFTRAAHEAVERSAALAWFNSLPFDTAAEQNLAASFVQVLRGQCPAPRPFPAWHTVARAHADPFLDALEV